MVDRLDKIDPQLARTLALPALFAAAAFCILIGLGVWQLQRLGQKQALLAAIAERSQAAPLQLPPQSGWAALDPQGYDYRRVTVTGTFLHGSEQLVFRILEGGKANLSAAGFLVLTPLRLAGGETIIVNRGFVPQDLRNPAGRQAGQVTGEVSVTGLMRPPEPRNLFTPADDPARGQWYTRDAVAMAAALNLSNAAPFTLDADATPNPGGWPQGGHTALALKNDHLSYALTWFGLALTLLGVFGAFVWKTTGAAARLRQKRATPGPL